MAPKIIRLEKGQEPVFLGDGVQIVQSGKNAGGVEVDAAEIKQGIVASIVTGMWDTASELLSAYPESAVAAFKYRVMAEVGVRPPSSGYAPVISGKERAAEVRKAKNDAQVVLSTSALTVPDTKEEKGGKKANVIKKKDVVRQLTQQRIEELAGARDYYTSVVKAAREFDAKKNDTVGLFSTAIKVMEGGTKTLQEAFEAGQAVSGSITEVPNDVEKAVARECVLAERKSGRVWSEEERGKWVMGFLTDMARRAVVETGKRLVEVDELVRLNDLSVSEDVGDLETNSKVLLDIPILDISMAESLGADKGAKGMALGVKIILGPGNRILAQYLAKRDLIAASPDTVDSGVYVVPGAALLASIQNGGFGGKKWRGFIDAILGDEKDSLPLVGNLVVGSTTKTGGNDVSIPMLNPHLGERILFNVKNAVRIVDKRTKNIKDNNPLVDVPPESLPRAAVKYAAERIMGLPNARRVRELVSNSAASVSNELAGVKIIGAEDVIAANSEEKGPINNLVWGVACQSMKDAVDAQKYLKDRRKWIRLIEAAEQSESGEYIRAFDERAAQLLAEKNGYPSGGKSGVIDDDALAKIKAARESKAKPAVADDPILSRLPRKK